eukprot:gb/GEZN01011405.1/.p1 GENE.gb/GEZN01011405.1/~~gb/GEZN01011405.1/.p1  ORF type:complete len:332 (-),score=46.11 gb/GEZN01011405.1/:66-1061(-)
MGCCASASDTEAGARKNDDEGKEEKEEEYRILRTDTPQLPRPEVERLVIQIAEMFLKSMEDSLSKYKVAGLDKDTGDSSPGSYVQWMDATLRPLRESIRPLLTQLGSAPRTNFTFLIPKEKLLELTAFPKHEDAIAMEILEKVPIDDMRMKLIARHPGKTIFIWFLSHKWSGNAPDTDDNTLLSMAKDSSAAKYVWFDYTCVPQNDAVVRNAHLLSIPNICHETTVVPMHANETLKAAYNTSVWCQLEAALLNWEAPDFKPEAKWTIYDWNDLYFVLPGFIERYCFSEKNWRFFSGHEGFLRTQMISSLVGQFITYHKTKQQQGEGGEKKA